jgi:hypothetical protein
MRTHPVFVTVSATTREILEQRVSEMAHLGYIQIGSIASSPGVGTLEAIEEHFCIMSRHTP